MLAGRGVTPRSLTGSWEGYISLDREMVAARAKKALDSLKTLIESERVLFDAGSAALDARAVARLTTAVSQVAQLDQTAATAGQSVRLSLTGRTDASGADATNATLAEGRVEAVASVLEAAGIPRSRLVPEPVATSRPLTSPDPVNQARINRSVSFNVRLADASSDRGGP